MLELFNTVLECNVTYTDVSYTGVTYTGVTYTGVTYTGVTYNRYLPSPPSIPNSDFSIQLAVNKTGTKAH